MSNMVVQTNILALNSHRNMKGIGIVQQKASQKLSSGYKINSAADDAAGLAISEKMRSQIRGLNMASKNAQDASSLIQTAEGGMNQVDDMVQRIRELVVYASNDTNDQSSTGNVQGDRQKIQDEIDQLLDEIDSMSGRVEFNKKTLINGSYSPAGALTAAGKQTIIDAVNTNASPIAAAKIALATALNAASTDFSPVSTAITNLGAAISGDLADDSAFFASTAEKNAAVLLFADVKTALDAVNITETTTQAQITTMFTNLDNALTALAASPATGSSAANTFAADVGSIQTDLGTWNTTVANVPTSYTSLATAQKVVSDAAKTAERTSGQSLYFQVGANSNQGLVMNIGSVSTDALGLGLGVGRQGKTIDVMKVTGNDTTGLLDILDNALTVVTTERSKLGAAQNRLEYTVKSLDISSENLSDAESRIRDTDMAQEMMNLTKANVLQQAAVSMLAQANQNPQSLLQLLR